jgi:AcrR family transcriptional regulator
MAQKRSDMILETRAKLIKAARESFATQGFAQSSMDVLTAQAGLTRGALYHHFGDKKGLLEAVIAQIDAEMTARLTAIVDEAKTTWDGFIDESIAYIKMALEPEIQRIVSVSTFATPSDWTVQTTRGTTTFTLKGEEDIRRLAAPALLIADSHGIQFLIRDQKALDKHSRKILDRFL